MAENNLYCCFREIKSRFDSEYGCCWNVVIGEKFSCSFDYEQMIQAIAGSR